MHRFDGKLMEGGRLVALSLSKYIRNDNVGALSRLLRAGLHIRLDSNNNLHLLEYAKYFDAIECAKLLIERSDRRILGTLSPSVLHRFCICNNEPGAKWLLSTVRLDPDQVNRHGQTALHLTDSRNICQLLLDNGATLDKVCKRFRWSPILYAIHFGHYEKLEYLLERGADVSCRGKHNESAWHIYMRSNYLELSSVGLIANLLHLFGVRVNWRSDCGRTPLHCLTSHTWTTRKIEHLLLLDVDIDARDDRGVTALHCAVEMGLTNVVNLLIDHGADINIESNDGSSPFKCAKQLFEYHLSQIYLQDRNTVRQMDSGLMVSLRIYQLLANHVLKINYLGLQVTAKNLILAQNFAYEFFDLNQRIIFEQLCRLEIEEFRMAMGAGMEEILRPISEPYYIGNTELSNRLEFLDTFRFGLYGKLICAKFDHDNRRYRLLNRAKNMFAMHSRKEPKLPIEVWGKVLANLSNEELAFIFPRDGGQTFNMESCNLDTVAV